MLSDEKKIKEVLDAGKEILFSRPELAAKELSDVINELDDGSSEMIRDRWGVAAWIVVNSISDFTTQSLVEHLPNVDSGPLTYEYTGYLLLTEYGVNLEELLLQAEKCGQFDKIILFVIENLVFEREIYEQNILPVLQVMENHLKHQCYYRLLWNYAAHIEKHGAQRLVENQIRNISGQAQYDLMNQLCAGWYASDEKEAGETLERLLAKEGIWNKKAAIKYLSVSLYYNRAIFQKHFSQIETMALMDEQLLLMIIPLYIEYICSKNNHTQNDGDSIKEQVLEHLKNVPSGSLDAKYSFLEAIQYVKDIPEDLNSIVAAILSQSFNKEQRFLNIVNHLLYVQIQKGELHTALNLMQNVFIANQYTGDYETFFRAMNLIGGEISAYTKDVTQQALAHLLSGDIGRLFFGLGLLSFWGDIKSLNKGEPIAVPNLSLTLNTSHVIQLEKAILYFTIDTDKICRIAFQLLELIPEESEQYITFCLEEVFENYPVTMYNTAKEYQDAAQQTQVELSQRVVQVYEQQVADRKKSYEIMDLRPSREHFCVYRKALAEQNRQICKQANKESIFGQMVRTRKLKYGVRNAHTMIGRKGEKIFQVNPYARIQHQMELPALYIRDPVGFELAKRAYLGEIKSNATNNKRLFAPTEREG